MNLETAIGIALRAHAGQTEKNGGPYILHPLRLMLHMDAVDEQVAAVFHDVVEDTPVTLEDLEAQGLSGAALEAVRLLTKEPNTDYKIESNLMEYLEAIKAHPVARKVKIADLEDNLNVMRLNELTEKDRARLDGYLRARRFLLS